MTTEQIIRQNANVPLEQSITPIALSLAKPSVFVAVVDATTTWPTVAASERLLVLTGKDNQDRMWAYAYTNEAELSKAFPQGSPFTELSFRDFFGIIELDAQFAGIFLNSGSDAYYFIPREVFEEIKQVLQQLADG